MRCMKLDQYLVAKGMSYRALAAASGLSLMTVWRAAGQHGGSEPGTRRALSEATRVNPTDAGGWVRESEILLAERFQRRSGSQAARVCRMEVLAPLSQVAEAVGLTASMMSRLERGQRRWRLEDAARWRRYMLDQAARIAAKEGRVVHVPDLDDLIAAKHRGRRPPKKRRTTIAA